MPRLRRARHGVLRIPERPDIEPVHPGQHGHPGEFYDWPPCVFIPRQELVCGFGTAERLPTLVLVEQSEVSGESVPVEVVYSIAPGLARIVYPGGTILLDEVGRQVAFYDAEQDTWATESLAACEARADSLRDRVRNHSQPAAPVFTVAGSMTLVSGYECQAYRVTIAIDRPGGDREEITQELWLTRDIETTEEIYATYRHTLQLFDNHWLEVPAERPPGIVFRTREVRLVTPRPQGEGPDIEDATVVEAGYRLYPLDFFSPFFAGSTTSKEGRDMFR